MKKITTILLISVYVLLSVGIAKSSHYCMGRLLSETYFSIEKTACCCTGRDNDGNSCCSDGLEIIKIETEQQRTDFILGDKQLYIIASVLVAFDLIDLSSSEVQPLAYTPDASPPDTPPYYLLHCSFVFYG